MTEMSSPLTRARSRQYGRASFRKFTEDPEKGFRLAAVFQMAPTPATLPTVPMPADLSYGCTPVEARQYLWPKEANQCGRDRIVWAFLYDDGSWTCALEDGVPTVDDTFRGLLMMARS